MGPHCYYDKSKPFFDSISSELKTSSARLRGLRRGNSTQRPSGCQGHSSEAVVSRVDFEGAGAAVQPTVTRLPTELGPAGCKEVAEVSC